jgi:hypothetical protein
MVDGEGRAAATRRQPRRRLRVGQRVAFQAGAANARGTHGPWRTESGADPTPDRIVRRVRLLRRAERLKPPDETDVPCASPSSARSRRTYAGVSWWRYVAHSCTCAPYHLRSRIVPLGVSTTPSTRPVATTLSHAERPPDVGSGPRVKPGRTARSTSWARDLLIDPDASRSQREPARRIDPCPNGSFMLTPGPGCWAGSTRSV